MSETNKRKPAEAWPVGHFIQEEMDARGWNRTDLLMRLRLEGHPLVVNYLGLSMILDCPTRGVKLGADFAGELAKAFGTSPEFWLNLDKAWQERQEGEHQNEIEAEGIMTPEPSFGQRCIQAITEAEWSWPLSSDAKAQIIDDLYAQEVSRRKSKPRI